jgi:alanine racemase
LNVDTGENRLGLSMAEAAQLSARLGFLNHGITLLMSSLASAENARDPQSERQVAWFGELRRLYRGIPASLAGASAILLNRKSHFDLVRADSALFGINPIPGSANRVGLRWFRSGTPTAFRDRDIPTLCCTPSLTGIAVR